LARCYSPPLLKEGDGAPKVVLLCLRLPIGHSSSKSLSTSNIVASSRIKNLRIEIRLCLPFVGGMFPPRGDLRGECACCLHYTLLFDVVIEGGDGILGPFCLTTVKGFALDMV
jgi:hypothetical protein